MKVNGKQVEQAVIDACITRMKQGAFKAMEIEALCTRMGVDWKSGNAMRVADRIIQRERKAGNIELTNRPYWFWFGKAEVPA